MAEAQKAGGQPISGLVGERSGQPRSIYPDPQAEECLREQGETVWAAYRSAGVSPDTPPSGRQLLISVDTKGVLQLRCRERVDGKPVERILKIRD
ncbi:MAG: hypothetical protein L0Y32_05430 [Nevskiales bacterium]|nr:hypothetical protein [Nevskiales bacterium]